MADPGPTAAGPLRALGLLLVDTRLPSGAHAHSSGTEQAVDEGLIYDIASLEAWLVGRIRTTVVLEAHGAACACASVALGRAERRTRLRILADEIDARMISAVARTVSRLQGAQHARALLVVALLASLAADLDELGARAALGANDPELLPVQATPALDRLLQIHATREERLFAS
ncbi:MAG: urease accessory UreF family protein [Acidimicrobiales bacterium]